MIDSLFVPGPNETEIRGRSILRQAYAAWELKRSMTEFYHEHLRRFAPQPETAHERVGRMIAENLATALRTCLEAEVATLEARRWQGWLTRAMRGSPGIRFADIMRGTGRN